MRDTDKKIVWEPRKGQATALEHIIWRYDDFSDIYILRTGKLNVEFIFSSALVGLGYDSSNKTSHAEESHKAF